jgi:septal ring factor EnvC (AmiA/AmiB activator)
LRAALLASAVAALGAGLLLGSGSAHGQALGSLQSELGQQQARQSALSASLGRLGQLISALDGQISLVQSREAALRQQLDDDQNQLANTRQELSEEEARLTLLRAELARSQMLLARQLVSEYENAKPDLVTILLEAKGFDQLLSDIQFLTDAEHRQQSMIATTTLEKAEAAAAAAKLRRLQRTEQRITAEAAQRVAALAGMNALLESRQTALARAQSAQRAALAASRARGRQLQADIAQVEAQQAAAERAAALATATPTATGPALGPSGGWAIPYAIVLCESGGQNLTPNSAGASGYYQIIPSTWSLFGGSGPAAYLAPKSEQDAVAARIWNNGAGASNWVCAGIVGIH